MQKKLKVLGIVSLIIGSIAALLCLFPMGLIVALPVGFIGMIVSGIYVFIDTKNDVTNKKITPGIIGMLLSSIPVLFILLFIILGSFKH